MMTFPDEDYCINLLIYFQVDPIVHWRPSSTTALTMLSRFITPIMPNKLAHCSSKLQENVNALVSVLKDQVNLSS